MSNLPKFKYHPNVYKDDIVFHIDGVCQCCGKDVNVFINSMYTRHEIQCICMNCIADGSAAKKFDGKFIQDVEKLVSDPAKTDELLHRTPGYDCWQGEYWLTCCDDYCEYLGPVIARKLNELDEIGVSDEVMQEYNDRCGMNLSKSDLLLNGSPSGYLFRCLHCGRHRIDVDFD
jgi:uncharacterized protein CbrC (UPF0167 family)